MSDSGAHGLRTLRLSVTTTCDGHPEPIGRAAVSVLDWLFNGTGKSDDRPVTGGLQALATLIVGLVTVALALVLYARTESEPSKWVFFLYVSLSLPLLLAMIIMVRSRQCDGFALDSTARSLGRWQALLWLFVISAVSVAYGEGVFSTPNALWAVNIETKSYAYKIDTPRFGIRAGDVGMLVVATLKTDGIEELPNPVVIDMELGEKYRKAWQIVSVSDLDNRSTSPALLPWGPPYHKKAMWEDVKVNGAYRIEIKLHRVDRSDRDAAGLVPSTGIHIKAYLTK